jgi:superkiller protein 3
MYHRQHIPKTNLLFSALLLACLTLSGTAFAAKRTFERDYTYQGGEADSKLSARAIATTEMRNKLLREVGEFLHSEQKSVDGEYSEKVEAITAGVIAMEVLEEKWYGDDYRFYIKAQMTVDPDEINSRINEVLNDKQKTRDLEDARKRTLAAEAEIERLKKELAMTKNKNNATLQTTYRQQTDRLSAEDYFTRGYNASESRDHQQAIEYYRQAITMDSTLAMAYNNMGVAYKELNHLQEAVFCYQKAVDIDSTLAPAYNNIGNAYYKMQQYKRSIDFYQKAIAAEPNDAIAYNNMGVAYKGLSDFAASIDCFTKAIELEPNDAMAYSNMGNTYQSQNNYPQAIDWYQKAITIDSLYATAYYNMGNAYDQLKSYAQSIACYKKVIAIDSTDAAAHYNVGLAFQNLKDYRQAIDWYQKTIAVDPLFTLAYTNMGNVYYKLNDYEKQIECYRQAALLGNTKAQEWLTSKGHKWADNQ